MTVVEHPYHCHRCGAICEADEQVCWHCEAAVEEGAEPVIVGHVPPGDAGQSPRHAFSVASLLLVTTLVSLVLGTFAMSPTVGIPTAVLLMIAGGRTVRAVNIRKMHGIAVSGGEVLALLFRAVWTTLVVLVMLFVVLWVSAIGGSLVYSFVCVVGRYLGMNEPVVGVAATISGWVGGVWIFLRASHWLVWIGREMLATEPYDLAD